MPVPTLVTDLSTTAASNSPSGSDNVFPDLDNYLRALSAFLASIRDNSGNGWTTPYLPLTYSAGTANGVVYLNGSKVVTTGSALTFDGTNFSTTGTATATKLIPTGGSATGNGLYLPAANTLGFSTNGTQAMTLDASGNLGVGTASPGSFLGTVKLVVGSAATTTTPGAVTVYSGTATYGGLYFADGTVGDQLYRGAVEYNHSTDALLLYSAGSERARITSGGAFCVNTTAAVFSAKLDVVGTGATAVPTNLSDLSGSLILVESTRASTGYGGVGYVDSNGGGAAVVFGRGGSYDTQILFCTNPASTAVAGAMTERARITSGGDLLVGKTAVNAAVVGVQLLPSGGVTTTRSGSTNATSTMEVYSTGASAYRFYVSMDGTVAATNTTISAISDQRFKENVRDLDVGLNAIMALKPRKFDWKAGKGKDKKDDRGFIAQEFEQVFPDLIDEWKDPAPEGEEPYKSVRQDLIPVLVKAMQEQQALITALTARVAALEAQP